jgi:hypothetical protein
MNVHERSQAELTSYTQARYHVLDVVFDTLSEEALEQSLLSGFDAATAMVGDKYVPTSDAIQEGILYATPITSHYLSWVGHYAVGRGQFRREQPAIGVYDGHLFRPLRSVGFEVNPGLTIVDACTDLFVWR